MGVIVLLNIMFERLVACKYYRTYDEVTCEALIVLRVRYISSVEQYHSFRGRCDTDCRIYNVHCSGIHRNSRFLIFEYERYNLLF